MLGFVNTKAELRSLKKSDSIEYARRVRTIRMIDDFNNPEIERIADEPKGAAFVWKDTDSNAAPA